VRRSRHRVLSRLRAVSAHCAERVRRRHVRLFRLLAAPGSAQAQPVLPAGSSQPGKPPLTYSIYLFNKFTVA